MKIITLGNCCKKSQQNHLNALEAAKRCGIKEVVENIGDVKEIINYGVMSTPALIIDGKVVSMGRILSVEQIEEIIKTKLESNNKG